MAGRLPRLGLAASVLLLSGCGGGFAPHPGRILFRTTGQPDRVEAASQVPDDIKFVYFAADGTETETSNAAVRRVPVVEIDMTRDPKTGWMEIVEYGPDRRFLKSIVGMSGPG